MWFSCSDSPPLLITVNESNLLVCLTLESRSKQQCSNSAVFSAWFLWPSVYLTPCVSFSLCSTLSVQSLCMETAQTNLCSTAVPAGRRSTESLSTGTGQRRLIPKTIHVSTVSVFLPVCCQVCYFCSWLDFSVPAPEQQFRPCFTHIWNISSFFSFNTNDCNSPGHVWVDRRFSRRSIAD